MTIKLDKYTEELSVLSESEPVAVQLTPMEAVAIINHVQLAA